MDRGCCMWTMIDFSTAEGRIWDWDPNDCCVLVPHYVVPRPRAHGLAGRLDGPRAVFPVSHTR